MKKKQKTELKTLFFVFRFKIHQLLSYTKDFQ